MADPPFTTNGYTSDYNQNRIVHTLNATVVQLWLIKVTLTSLNTVFKLTRHHTQLFDDTIFITARLKTFWH